MAEIAKAYVQIIPTTKDIASNLKSVLNDADTAFAEAGESAGASFGNKLKSSIVKLGIGAFIGKTIGDSIKEGANFEQLWGGAKQIFSGMDTSKILNDATEAYKTLGMSANEYLEKINDVGAAFKSTMGSTAGYETAKQGLQAISDYASGTGKDLATLSDKFTLITRSTSSYQSIADQFSGILPATSKAFLEQSQAAGTLSTSYKSLSEVPIAEYQKAVTQALQSGVRALNLEGNTAKEASSTVSGAFNEMRAAWDNVKTALTTEEIDASEAFRGLIKSFQDVMNSLLPMVEKMAPEIVNVIVLAFTELVPKLLDIFLNAFEEIIKNIPDIWGKLSDSGKVVVAIGLVVTAFKVLNAAIQATSYAAEVLKAIVADPMMLAAAVAIAAIGAALVYANNKFDEFLKTSEGKQFATQFVELENEIKEAGGLFDWLIDKVGEFHRTIWEAMRDVQRAFIEGFTEPFKKIGSIFSEAFSNLSSAANEAIGKIVSAIEDGLQKGIEAVTSWGSSMKEKAQNAINQMAEGIVKTISELPQRLKEAGIQMAQGLVQGFNERIGRVTRQITDAVQRITDNVKKAMDINSPSRVWANEIGAQMAAGVSVGFNSEMSKVNSEIKSDLNGTLSMSNAQVKSAIMDRPNLNSSNRTDMSDQLAKAFNNLTIQNNVTLQGDAKTLFNVMQKNNRIYKNSTGRSAFA